MLQVCASLGSHLPPTPRQAPLARQRPLAACTQTIDRGETLLFPRLILQLPAGSCNVGGGVSRTEQAGSAPISLKVSFCQRFVMRSSCLFYVCRKRHRLGSAAFLSITQKEPEQIPAY